MAAVCQTLKEANMPQEQDLATLPEKRIARYSATQSRRSEGPAIAIKRAATA